MKRYKNSLIFGSLILSIGAIGSKIVGAVYRIFLTNILGAEGIGLYQLVFPYYVLLLTISTTGLPQAIATLVTPKLKNKDFLQAKKIFDVSKKSLLVIGTFFALLLIVFSSLIANILQKPNLNFSFVAIAPSILLVSLISAYRGFFSAKYDMSKTAISQILEQIIKAVFCITFSLIFMPNVYLAVTFSIFSVSIAEFVALIYLRISAKNNFDLPLKNCVEDSKNTEKSTADIEQNQTKIQLKKQERNQEKKQAKNSNKKIFLSLYALAIPLTLSALLLPLSQVIDGILVTKILNPYTNGTMLYGLLTGAVFSIASLPICVCSTISTCTIPKLAGEKRKGKIIKKSLLLTLAVSLVAGIGTYFFAPIVTKIMYFSLPKEQIEITINLLKSYTPSIFLLPTMTTLTSILVAQKKAYLSCISMLIATATKVFLNFLLLPKQNLNIFGAVISQNICFLIATILNLIFVFYIYKKGKKDEQNSTDTIVCGQVNTI